MDLYQCYCGFGSSNGAHEGDIINHIRGVHDVHVNTGHRHFAHCNDCPRRNGHGKTLGCMEDVIDHLNDVHGIDVFSF